MIKARLEYFPAFPSEISEEADWASRFAYMSKLEVSFTFNGVVMTITPGDTKDAVIDRYRIIIKEREGEQSNFEDAALVVKNEYITQRNEKEERLEAALIDFSAPLAARFKLS